MAIRIIISMVLLLCSSSVFSTSITLPQGVSLRINFNGVDAATTAYSGDCVSGADCDTKTTVSTPGAVTTSAGFDEDTFGIGTVDSINQGLANVWQPSTTGTVIEMMFGDLYDVSVTNVGGTTQTFSEGGFVKFWEHPAGTLPSDPDPTARTGLMSYPGVSTGELLLELAFAGGCDAVFTTATLCGAFSNTTFGGGSAAVFDVVSGSLASVFDTNTIIGSDGSIHDLEGSFTFECLNPGSTTTGGSGCDPSNTSALFSSNVNGPIVGSASSVAEPAPFFLLLAGLFGLGSFTKKRLCKD